MTEIAIIETPDTQALRIPAGRGRPKRDDVLDPETVQLIMEGTPPNTIKTYSYGWRTWLLYCEETGRCPYPATSATLANFVPYMGRKEKRKGKGMYSPNTIETCMAAVVVYHRMAAEKWGDEEVSPPDNRRAYKALKGYIVRWIKAGNRIRKADSLPLQAIRDSVAAMDISTARGKRDRFLMLAGVGMGARRSELPSLDFPDVSLTEHGLKIYLPMSKTNHTGDGDYTYLPYGKHNETCVVLAWIAYRQELVSRGISSGPILRPIDWQDRVFGQSGNGIFAGRATQPRLTPGGFENIFHACIKPLNLVGRFTPHSLRATMFTLGSKAGASAPALNRQGRLTATSTVGLQYVRDAEMATSNAMTKVDL